MPTWGQLLVELAEISRSFTPPAPDTAFDPTLQSPYDRLRRKYLTSLSQKTGRATILYYSGFQEHPDSPPGMLTVTSADIAGFMEACSDAPENGLDLFLHSPGGDPDAAEQICAYLRTQFEHIRAVVPVYGMSAATMMALSADEILMGAHSQLGPIDPQMTVRMPEGPRSASAQAIRDQFALAIEQCQDPKNLAAWTPILRSYAPGLLAACDHASKRATAIVATALEKHMFAERENPAESAKLTADWFGDATKLLSHGRPVRRDEAREHGVEVKDLEADGELQDLVLSVHHATMITLAQTPTAKLIESHRGRAWLQTQQQIQIAIPGPFQQLPPGVPTIQPAGTGNRKPPPPPRNRAKKR